jgi:hypothetical protein
VPGFFGFVAKATRRRRIVTEFERHLPLIISLAATLERWQLRHETVNVRALARGLRQPLAEIYKVLDVLGVKPRDWSEPERYRVEDILEAATRHEVANRF